MGAIPKSTDQVGEVGQGKGPAGTNKDTDIAIPAIIPIAHHRETLCSHAQYIHGAHVHTGAASIAFALVNFNPAIIRFIKTIWVYVRHDLISLGHKSSRCVHPLFFNMCFHPRVLFRIFPMGPFLKRCAHIKIKFRITVLHGGGVIPF